MIAGLWTLVLVFSLMGCSHLNSSNEGQLQSYPAPAVEAGWIREGQPIVFDNERWYPVDDMEVLMDSEVYQIGEFKGVQIFIDKADTKPYDRIYTKFSKNKFRYFEQREDD